jgi:hypothetical protein
MALKGGERSDGVLMVVCNEQGGELLSRRCQRSSPPAHRFVFICTCCAWQQTMNPNIIQTIGIASAA